MIPINIFIFRLVSIGLLWLVGLGLCAQGPSEPSPPKSAGAEPSEIEQLFADYHERFLTLFPLEASGFGDPRYNDQLQIDISPEFIAKKRQFFRETLNRLNATEISEANELQRLCAEILKYELQIRLEGIDFRFERIPFNQFEGLPISFAQMGSGIGNHPFKSVKDYDDWLKRITAFTHWGQEAIERFREGMQEGYVLPRVLVERMVDQLLDTTIVHEDPRQSLFFAPINRMPSTFSVGDRTRLTSAYENAIRDEVIPTYRKLGTFLRDEYLPRSRTTAGLWALERGKEQYEYWVRYWTTTALTPEQIFHKGEQEVARIAQEMEAVRERMGFRGSLSEFFDFLRDDPQFKPFKEPKEILSFFHHLQKELEPRLAVAFRERPRTPFEIRRTESFREKTASAEYMPGSEDGTRPGIFYVPIPNAAEFNITSGMESLFLHEALPGHHYQISLQQENQQLPKFARFLWYGAFGEGWALYCESMGEELGLYSDPRQKIGALGDEMHRAVRLVVDVGLHWKGWTREEALEYMLQKEPISRDNAIAEVERYMAYPGQALSYKVGQLTIRELRKQQEARRGTRFSLPEFHQQILGSGSMPLEILERRLKEEKVQ